MLRILNIVGTRPNLVKMAAVSEALRAHPDVFAPLLVHTGQHRDPAMAGRFLSELQLPTPDVSLACDGGRQAEQIQRMIDQMTPVLERLHPDLVIVVGDVNSTAAGASAAFNLGIPVAHVEAGLRSFDRTMPEEMNRLVVDELSSLLFASEASGIANLMRDGRPVAAVHHVGNVMIDTLVRFRSHAATRDPAAAFGVGRRYGVLTLHRPSNVDNPAVLGPLLHAIGSTARHLPVLFPIHPRTRHRLEEFGLDRILAALPAVRVVDPLGYIDMLALMERAVVVLTDSGGVQEETTFLGVPCLTLRDVTERPATVTDGTNRVIGTEPDRIVDEVKRVLDGDYPLPRCPPLWDGHAAQRIVEILAGRRWARSAITTGLLKQPAS